MKALVFYPQCGLANRLRGIASAKILADHTGRRLLVNWEPSETECNITWEDLFVNQLERYHLPFSSFQKGVDLYDDTGSHDFYWEVPQLLAQNKSDVIAIRTFRNLKPKGMTERDFRRAKSRFYNSLVPISAVDSVVSKLQERHFKDNDVIGVHIRRTDYYSYMGKNMSSIAPTGLFVRTMRDILRKNSKTKFFLATDDKNEEQLVGNNLEDAVIVYGKKAMRRSTVEGMQDALIDWLLLSRTSRIIGSYRSSFNEEASIINMIELETIPKRALLLNLKAHYRLMKAEGLKNVFSYSYRYRKERLLCRLKEYLK